MKSLRKKEIKKKMKFEELINKNQRKEKSKERKADEDEMDKVKSKNLNCFFMQFIYQFYY